MGDEVFKLKGNQTGLQLVFAPGIAFETLRNEIQKRLESGSQFFKRGTVIQLVPDQLSKENEESLRKLFHQYGVLFRVEPIEEVSKARRPIPKQKAPETNIPAAPAAAKESPAEPKPPEEHRMMVINRTVRSGQEIQTQGSVLICGNVNPGAEIIAGGSIDIRGTCRGIVHAGAYGDRNSFIIADCLMPVQIRIADLIAQAPDSIEKPAYAEKASVKNNQIIIEPIER